MECTLALAVLPSNTAFGSTMTTDDCIQGKNRLGRRTHRHAYRPSARGASWGRAEVERFEKIGSVELQRSEIEHDNVETRHVTLIP
ncbi:hypothetical protein BDV98DRAFT_52410 [Pterulicium gracile]|uniref:Uncharacterized protein n=1 Tax=Pterulicium gracile TaxID=1884261 RepID=A0A5C3QNM7_9AGAR|nr:hypothetical protein BDV98DRAFT_52410 [Pterula gracilis]